MGSKDGGRAEGKGRGKREVRKEAIQPRCRRRRLCRRQRKELIPIRPTSLFFSFSFSVFPQATSGGRAAPLHLIGNCGNRKEEGEEGREGDAISHSTPLHSIYLSGGGFIYKKCEEWKEGRGGMDDVSASHSLTLSLPLHPPRRRTRS